MLPAKTVERLSAYRRTLDLFSKNGTQFVFSHDLAARLNLTPVQVRRDLMLIGYSGQIRKGYHVTELRNHISETIDSHLAINIAIFGIGDLGKALAGYFMGKHNKMNLVAAFDIDPNKVGKVIAGVKCYHLSEINQKVKELNLSIALLTVPTNVAEQVAEIIVLSGIKGIMNYTTVPLTVTSEVCLEEYDMITSLEKLVFFVKTKNKKL
ncbi:MAG TPA: redox-sensing transcriptional repressor Rex [Bacteroidales bacterium]|nr:redox-sensing transcriptional repressor Rex [Bacteroidales bacterium]